MDPAPAYLLDWDTNFFGVRIGRIRSGSFDPIAVDAWRRENHVRCLYYLAELNDSQSIHAAEGLGFHLVDIRTTFYAHLSVQVEREPTHPIRSANPADLPALQELTANSFHNSRFYHDPNFPREKCDELYAIWVGNQLKQPRARVWVTEDQSGLTGFVTVVDLSHVRSSISLIGIAVRTRGQGLGRNLVNHVLSNCEQRGFQEFEVITQASNAGAMGLYQACGLRVVLQQAWLHGWFE